MGQTYNICCSLKLSSGAHIHFLDGTNGGFATTAVQLKAEIKEGD